MKKFFLVIAVVLSLFVMAFSAFSGLRDPWFKDSAVSDPAFRNPRFGDVVETIVNGRTLENGTTYRTLEDGSSPRRIEQ